MLWPMKLLDLMIGLFYLSRRNIFKINEFILSELTIKCVIGCFFFFFFFWWLGVHRLPHFGFDFFLFFLVFSFIFYLLFSYVFQCFSFLFLSLFFLAL
jgi:hypothetical protein